MRYAIALACWILLAAGPTTQPVKTPQQIVDEIPENLLPAAEAMAWGDEKTMVAASRSIAKYKQGKAEIFATPTRVRPLRAQMPQVPVQIVGVEEHIVKGRKIAIYWIADLKPEHNDAVVGMEGNLKPIRVGGKVVSLGPITGEKKPMPQFLVKLVDADLLPAE